MKRTLCLLMTVGCSGGFEFGTQGQLAELTGQIIHLDGRAEPALTVSLYRNQVQVAQTNSGPDGRFTISIESEGRHQLATHAGGGIGVLADVVLTPGTRNDVGALVLRALHERPAVLALRGLGYEERLTNISSKDVNVRHVRLDAQHVLLLANESRNGMNIVQTTVLNTSDGSVIRGPALAPSETVTLTRAIDSAGSDPIAFVQTYENGRIIPTWLVGQHRATRIDRGFDRGMVALFDDGAETTVLWEDTQLGNSGLHAERWNRAGEIVATRRYQGWTALSFSLWTSASFRDRRVIVADQRTEPSQNYIFDLSTWTMTPTGLRDQSYATLTNKNDVTLVAAKISGATSSVATHIVGIDAGGHREIARLPGDGLLRLTLFDNEAYIRTIEPDAWWVIDLQDESVQPLNMPDIGIPGFQQACVSSETSNASCFITDVSTNRMRFVASPCGSDETACIIDIFDSGQTRSFLTPRFHSHSHTLRTSEDGRFYIWTKSIAHGHAQLFLAPLEPEASFRQVTWFPRDHTLLAFDAERQWLYTLMPDPLDDHPQVFRISTESR